MKLYKRHRDMLTKIKANPLPESRLIYDSGLSFLKAKTILDELVKAKEVVKENGIYYDQKNTDKK